MLYCADELVSVYSHFVRDLPGPFDVWMENMVDQSHVAFAHHGPGGNRSAAQAPGGHLSLHAILLLLLICKGWLSSPEVLVDRCCATAIVKVFLADLVSLPSLVF